MTLLAYRYALDPTPRQERALRCHAGAARVAFNGGLARVTANLAQREAERTYGIGDDELTPALSWSLYSLRKAWNEAKDTVAPWWRECSKEAFNTGLDQLARALKNWGDGRRGKRKGRPVGFPRFRSRRTSRPSVRFTTGAIGCEPTHAVLPRLGRVKLHERAGLGDARILSATVRYERGRWFVAFTVEQDLTRPAPARPDVAAGVDLGIKTLAVVATSVGEVVEVPNPRHLGTALRKVRRLSRTVSRRRGPDRRTGQRPSNRWRRADAARNRALGRVADQRRDAIHQLTTALAATYGTVVVEDLHVAGTDVEPTRRRPPGRRWRVSLSTRHARSRSDRDRPNPRRDCDQGAYSCFMTRNGLGHRVACGVQGCLDGSVARGRLNHRGGSAEPEFCRLNFRQSRVDKDRRGGESESRLLNRLRVPVRGVGRPETL